MMKRLLFFIVAALSVPSARAQLVEPNQVGVRMGHIHLAVKDVDAQKRFWISAMGGALVKNGPLELIQFPGVFIMLRAAEASTPPAGSIVDHFGFTVKDMPAALARWKAADIKTEPTENPNEVYVLAPDGIRLEVYGEPALPTPVSITTSISFQSISPQSGPGTSGPSAQILAGAHASPVSRTRA
jgi:catechol 2,3-dioxygenase-like lactoylglutathione lyase family enzyme